MNQQFDYDFVIIGSGFGGSVSALRLSEKGYRVLVLEKGKWYQANDFPKTNWDLKKWLWIPLLRFFGVMKLTFFRHIGIVSGVGVGGGSLVYGNTLPIPPSRFFQAKSWSHLADWEEELKPFYQTALTMLGATPNPRLEAGDKALEKLAIQLGREEEVKPTTVAVYFGKPGETVPDPYFGGQGPERTGCIFCGACFIGCRHNAKNTLDKNYLYLAQKRGAEIRAESEVKDVSPLGDSYGKDGYEVTYVSSTSWLKKQKSLKTKSIVFAGGVLGTMPLLLKLKTKSLPFLSDQLGRNIRTNSESLIGITSLNKEKVYSDGIAIGSILNTDENSFVEPIRYPSGSGFWRLMAAPMVKGSNFITRLFKIIWDIIRHPIKNLKVMFVDDWAKRTQSLLFMQTLDSTLRFVKSPRGMKTKLDKGSAPTAFIPEANELAFNYGRIIDGKPVVLITESLLGIPTTAHILGGATMGSDATEGVIDKNNQVFGYENIWICDGSTISANPGVNPSLTITALTERAMSKIPPTI